MIKVIGFVSKEIPLKINWFDKTIQYTQISTCKTLLGQQ